MEACEHHMPFPTLFEPNYYATELVTSRTPKGRIGSNPYVTQDSLFVDNTILAKVERAKEEAERANFEPIVVNEYTSSMVQNIFVLYPISYECSPLTREAFPRT